MSKKDDKESLFCSFCGKSQKEVKKLIDETVKAYGKLDIIVNNVSVAIGGYPITDMSNEDWQKIISINFSSVFYGCKHSIPYLKKNNGGSIINIGSIVGSTGNPGQGNYAASKAALLGMSKSLANEVASRGITVNCIAPGFVKTAMTDKLNDNQKEAIKSKIPTGRLGEASDIAYATLYLSSEEASYITGSTIHVNGAMAMI